MPGYKPDPATAPIDRFTGEWFFLSNFAACNMMVDGFRYTTLEAAFQAAKTSDPGAADAIRRASTPGQAKRLGRRAILRKDWQSVKEIVMKRLLRIKFSDPWMSEHLLATGDRHLEEGNTWADTFWGTCNGHGENRLGVLLMEVREEIRTDRRIPLQLLSQNES